VIVDTILLISSSRLLLVRFLSEWLPEIISDLLTEPCLDDLAAGGAGQLVRAYIDVHGQLEGGQPWSQMLDDVLRAERRAALQLNHCADQFAKHAIGNSDDRGVEDVGM
jgi:hypothetical protein